MPGGVVSAARPVRGGLFFCRLVELWGGSSIEIAPGDDLGPFGHPDHPAKGARCRQEPAETTNRYAVGATAVERMVAIDHPGGAGAFCLERKRGEGDFRAGRFKREATDCRGGDGLRIAAPFVAAGTYPALNGLDAFAVDRKPADLAMFVALGRRDIHGCAESPEKQTEGDAQHRGQDRATVENGAPLWAAARKAELS